MPILTRENLGQVGVNISVDLVVDAISLGASAAAAAHFSVVGGMVIPVLGVAAGFIVGLAIGVGLNMLFEHLQAKKRIYEYWKKKEREILNITTADGFRLGDVLFWESPEVLEYWERCLLGTP